MKTRFALVFLGLLLPVFAEARTFDCEEVGISLTFPDDYVRGKKDDFGYLILPRSGSNEKIRIQGTPYRNITANEAVLSSVAKTNEIRKEQSQPLEKLFASTPVLTKTGIKGEKASIGPDNERAQPYLNRYYFLKPDGSIFCVLVYFYNDLEFERRCEKAILETLSFSVVSDKRF